MTYLHPSNTATFQKLWHISEKDNIIARLAIIQMPRLLLCTRRGPTCSQIIAVYKLRRDGLRDTMAFFGEITQCDDLSATLMIPHHLFN
ncbi:hypothetical protein TNIN_314141 [Trichonephila inaurata madagascariensis]|uniref:Uncharacterized protein n=1 Tax=Trichonephila inaurata madagascariensis TaxID=2747483 RepID=A0A8X7BZV3_9ARAC|nr:hypothetical protein TNIN_314141 [Trichonephila inaurata madagascariensis]